MRDFKSGHVRVKCPGQQPRDTAGTQQTKHTEIHFFSHQATAETDDEKKRDQTYVAQCGNCYRHVAYHHPDLHAHAWPHRRRPRGRVVRRPRRPNTGKTPVGSGRGAGRSLRSNIRPPTTAAPSPTYGLALLKGSAQRAVANWPIGLHLQSAV